MSKISLRKDALGPTPVDWVLQARKQSSHMSADLFVTVLFIYLFFVQAYGQYALKYKARQIP